MEQEWRQFHASQLAESPYDVADNWADIETFQYLNPAALMIIRNFIFKKSSDRRSELAWLVTSESHLYSRRTYGQMYSQFRVPDCPSLEKDKIIQVKCAKSGTIYYKNVETNETAWRRVNLTKNPSKHKK